MLGVAHVLEHGEHAIATQRGGLDDVRTLLAVVRTVHPREVLDLTAHGVAAVSALVIAVVALFGWLFDEEQNEGCARLAISLTSCGVQVTHG